METPEKSPITISARLTQVLADRPEVLDAYLFGSTVTGQVHAHSDIDVAVYIDESSHHNTGFGYQAELTSVLMSALGTNRIDVVVLNKAPPLLYHRVLRDGMRLFARDLAKTTTREGDALSRYCDYMPHIARLGAASRQAGSRSPDE